MKTYAVILQSGRGYTVEAVRYKRMNNAGWIRFYKDEIEYVAEFWSVVGVQVIQSQNLPVSADWRSISSFPPLTS